MKANKDTSKTAKGKSRNAMPSDTRKDNSVVKESNSPDSNSENISPTLHTTKRNEKKSEDKKKLSPPKQKSVSRNNSRSRTNKSDVAAIANSPLNSSVADETREHNSTLNITKDKNESSLSIEINQTTPDVSTVVNGQERKLRSGKKKNTQSIFDTPTSTTATVESFPATELNPVDLNEVKEAHNLALEDSKLKNEIKKEETKNDNQNESMLVDAKELIHSIATQLDENLEVEKSETNVAKENSESHTTSLMEDHVVENRHEETYVIPLDNPILIANIKSPSAVSIDSAKGSSIGNDSDCTIFASGDIYWGRIHNFSYWACIVCPDDTDDDKPLTRLIDQQLEVHVRFFADNARHSWVKRENMMPYQGLESYRENLQELKDKYGAKSVKCQSFLPKRTKLKAWLDAVKEADEVANAPYAERITKFFQLNNIARERNKEERIRRKSISVSRSSKAKLNDGTDVSVIGPVETTQLPETATRKRNRSISPVSPAFSPIRKAKRRKTTADLAELMKSKQSNAQLEEKLAFKTYTNSSLIENVHNTSFERRTSLLKSDLFNSREFNYFYEAMKEFVMKGAESEYVERNLYIAMKNTWALKNILEEQLGHQQVANVDSKGIKRLSQRLKDLEQRQFESSPLSTPNKSVDYKPSLSTSAEKIKQRKFVNRPLEEVIDDIFNLDTRYLFDNLGRDPVCKYCCTPGGNLKRCSKSCQSWLHPECLILETESQNGTIKAKQSFIGNKRRLSKRQSGSTITTIAPPIVTPTMVHVTADSFENVSQQQQSIKINTSTEEKNHSDTTQTEQVEISTPVVCRECANDEKPKCFVCHSSDKQEISKSTTNNEKLIEEKVACNMPHCTRVYHPSCLKYWPQAKITKSKNSISALRCPSHVCHTCVSDDPKGKFQHLNNAHTTKCVKCPATYHMDSTCIPAGSEILTAAHIICPRHGVLKSDQHVNVSWCFICVRGGQLICCETCPTAVHAECSNVALDPNESYICDECESGRLPLYGEMVWAKFNTFRWWPAIILPPTEVPLNIRNKTHNTHEFVVRFFGTHDHGWISRRRVYLYVEGDWSEPPKTKKVIDQSYLRGVLEARETYEVIKAKNIIRVGENENKEKLHPQPYVKIRVNRAVPPVKLHPDLEKVNKCDCNPFDEYPCGPETNCLNRVLYHECNPKICPAGDRCQNQMFESRVSPALEIFYAKKERGFGLRCTEAVTAGTFIIEYVGEVINSAEFQRRMQQKSADRDENYYFLTVEKDYIIDAGPKGNMARFMNHSCDPNCETQKWSVNGLNRIGLFAIKDIAAHTELTFNYHWDELLGNDKKVCFCGSGKCTGQIGKLSKDLKVKQTHSDETVTEVNASFSTADHPRTSKPARHRKNEPMKSTQQKRSKSEVGVGKKPRGRKRKRVPSVAASTTAAIDNNIKNTESNDKNNNV